MPQRRNSEPPPPAMTWAKALPVLAISIIFDGLRLMFEWFIFFGPAMAALYCTAQFSGTVSTLTLGLAGTKTTLAGCAVAAGALGLVGVGATAVFGMVMAMAVGLAGWLTILIVVLVSNGRILRENLLLFSGSLLISELPFIGSFPAITFSVWRMYSKQIREERAALERWSSENATAQLQERNQQALQMMQVQAAQQAQTEQQQQEEMDEEQEAQEEEMAEEEAANEDELYETETPSKLSGAA